MTTTTPFAEATFIAEVINEYHRRCENEIYDDIYEIVEQLIVRYPDYQMHYPNISNVTAHLYYTISDILDREYESGADTDIENE
jgi:hypothetical protein